jgi:hypothetical protein
LQTTIGGDVLVDMFDVEVLLGLEVVLNIDVVLDLKIVVMLPALVVDVDKLHVVIGAMSEDE